MSNERPREREKNIVAKITWCIPSCGAYSLVLAQCPFNLVDVEVKENNFFDVRNFLGVEKGAQF